MPSKPARLRRSQAALLEVALLFAPAIPAYLWMWPAVSGTAWIDWVQSLVYLYLLAGTLFIGLRRWNPDQLGLNRQGFWFSMCCGMVLLLARSLIVLSLDIPLSIPSLTLQQWIGELVFYFLLVGLVEELLFRGLIYRALDEWAGYRWAIWGSSLAFGIYHIGSGGLPGLLGGIIIGAIFAAIRWRAGGILGLIIVHGLIDLAVVEVAPEWSNQGLFQVQADRPGLTLLGTILLLALLLYLVFARHDTSLPQGKST